MARTSSKPREHARPGRLSLSSHAPEYLRPPTFLVLIILLVLSACGESDEQDIVAEIGDLRVTTEQYLVALKRYYRQTGQGVNLGSDVKGAVLKSLLDRYAGVKFAQDAGWATDREALIQREIIRRKVLIEEYQRRTILDEVRVTDDDLRDLFLRLNTELRASHLYAPSREKADSLYRALHSGATFEQLAVDVFHSPQLARSAGDLGYFTVDEMDIAFERASYDLRPGEVSAPVRTSTGYSIIKVTDRREKPILTEHAYADARRRLYPLALDQKQELATRADIDDKVSRLGIPDDVVVQLWDVVRRVGPESSTEYVDLRPLLSSHRGLHSRLLAQLNDFMFTVDDFVDEAFFTLSEDWEKIQEFHHFRDFVEGIAYRSYALHTIQNSNLLDTEFVEGAFRETFHSYLYHRFEEHVKNVVTVSDDEIRREYDLNQDVYVEPLRLNLRELGVSTWKQAESAMDLLNSGVDFVKVVERLAIEDELKARGGELGFIDVARFGTLSIPLAGIEPGEVKGPFQLHENRIVIFKCIDRRDERPLSFEEAKSDVRTVLLNKQEDEARAELLSLVKSKHGANLDLKKIELITLEM